MNSLAGTRRTVKLFTALAVLFSVLLLTTCASASAADYKGLDYREEFTDYYVTLAVGDTITFYDMVFHSQDVGRYGEEYGKPEMNFHNGTYVYSDYDNPVSVSNTFYNVMTGGDPNMDSNYYYCTIDATITAVRPGTVTYEYMYHQMLVSVQQAPQVHAPRIHVTVVEEDQTWDPSSCRIPPCVYSTTNNLAQIRYSTLPQPARPGWSFNGWYTAPEGGVLIDRTTYQHNNYDIDWDGQLYARWTPAFRVDTNLPGGGFGNPGSGDTITINQAIIPYETNVQGLQNDGFTLGLWIEQYDQYKSVLGVVPDWSVVSVSDPTAELELQAFGENNILLRTDHGRPQEPTQVQAVLSCSWGGTVFTLNVVINYQDVPLPTDTDIPAIIDLQIGHISRFDFHFTDNYSYENRIWYTGAFDDGGWQRFDSSFIWSSDGNTLTIEPTEPGYYPGTLALVDANVAIREKVLFRVADLNGNCPMPRQFENTYTLNYLLIPEDTNGLNAFSENWQMMQMNYPEVLNELYPDEEWVFTTRYIRGARLQDLRTEQYRWIPGGLYFYIGNFGQLSDSSYSVYDLTLTCGDYTETTRITFTFTLPVLPDITFETLPTLKVGETYTATVEISDLNWTDEMYILYYDFSDDSGFEKRTGFIGNEPVFYITPHRPGIYWGAAHIHAANMRIQQDRFFFAVTDEEGNVPEVLPLFNYSGDYFESVYMLGTFKEEGVEGWFSDPTLFTLRIANEQELLYAYGDEPEVVWSVNYREGYNAGVKAQNMPSQRTQNGGCRLKISKMPSKPQMMIFDLVCSWNGHTNSMPVKVQFINKPNRLPNDTTLPDRLTLPVGEIVTLTGAFPDGDYDVEAYEMLFEVQSRQLFGYRRDSGTTFSLRGDNAGTASGMTGVGGYGRAYYFKPLTINVVDTVITLPEALETIESEAFAGIDDVVFYIPASVSGIADDAFEPHVTVICPLDSYAYRRCTELGLTVIGK